MIKVLIVALALAAPALATIEILATTTNAAGATIGTTTLLSTTAATGLFAVVGIGKAIGLGLLARELANRNKREVSNSLGAESGFSIISQLEPAQCYRRLICDVATGKLPEDESDAILLAPFQGDFSEADVTSQSFDFRVAAENGRKLQSVERCELRYSCPLNSQQLRDIFREI